MCVSLSNESSFSQVPNERVYRFEFPERAGALTNFLDSLNGGAGSTALPWNVSLFHYRNHGGDVGRVLAGMQVCICRYKRFSSDPKFAT